MKPFNTLLQEAKIEKQKFIEAMSAAHSATKHPFNRLSEARYRLEVIAALKMLGIPEKIAAGIYEEAKTQHISQDRSGVMTFVPVFKIYEVMRARRLIEAAQFKVGDKVHMGHGSVGGAGFEGEITKIEGDAVYIKNKWHGKVQKGLVKNLSKL